MAELPSPPCPECGKPMWVGIGHRDQGRSSARLLMCTPPLEARTEAETFDLVRRRAKICVHYESHPGMKVICRAGVDPVPRSPLPCVTEAPCPLKRGYTPEEAIAEDDDRRSQWNGCGHMMSDEEAMAYLKSASASRSDKEGDANV